MTEKIITIFGSGRVGDGDSSYEMAYSVGKSLAQAGFIIANGGDGGTMLAAAKGAAGVGGGYGGTMLAAAKGAAGVGGEIIGVTCSAFKRSRPNEYITREIITDSLDERLDKLIKLGLGYVVLPGGTGTLLELAQVWELKNKGFLEGNKPVILAGGFWKPLVDLVASEDPDSSRYVHLADGPEQVKDILKETLLSGSVKA